MPGGQQRILLLPDGRDKRLNALIDETGRHFRGRARVIDEHRLELVPARARARNGAGGRERRIFRRQRPGRNRNALKHDRTVLARTVVGCHLVCCRLDW